MRCRSAAHRLGDMSAGGGGILDWESGEDVRNTCIWYLVHSFRPYHTSRLSATATAITAESPIDPVGTRCTVLLYRLYYIHHSVSGNESNIWDILIWIAKRCMGEEQREIQKNNADVRGDWSIMNDHEWTKWREKTRHNWQWDGEATA